MQPIQGVASGVELIYKIARTSGDISSVMRKGYLLPLLQMNRNVRCEFWTSCQGGKAQLKAPIFPLKLKLPSTYHPTDPQASLTGSAHCHASWYDVWWRLECLDDPRRVTEWALSNNVHLSHPKSEGQKREQPIQKDREAGMWNNSRSPWIKLWPVAILMIHGRWYSWPTL